MVYKTEPFVSMRTHSKEFQSEFMIIIIRDSSNVYGTHYLHARVITRTLIVGYKGYKCKYILLKM